MSSETDALQRTVAMQGAMLDALSPHISLLDEQGRIVAVNKAWRCFADDCGLASPASGIGLSYLEVCDQSEGPNAHEAAAVAAGTRAVLDGTRATFSLEYPCHSPGRQRWFRLTVTRVENGAGAVSMHVDITAEWLAAQALRDQEGLLESALRIGQMGSWVFDIRQQRLWWAEQTHELFGVTREQLGESFAVFQALVLEEDRPLLEAAYARGSTSPHEAVELEYRVRKSDGSLRWILERGSVECDDEGTPIRRLGVVMDVTSRKRAEEERRELLASEQASRKKADAASRYYQSLFESAPGRYVVLLPGDFTIVAASDSYLHATMTTREQIVGRHIFDVFADDPEEPDADGVRNLRASLERVKTTQQTDVMAVQRFPIRQPAAQANKFEERYWSCINSPVPGPDGEVAYIICRPEDVTEYIRVKERSGEGAEARLTLESRAEQLELDVGLRRAELQRAIERDAQSQASLRLAGRVAKLGGWVYSIEEKVLTWSGETAAIHDEPAGFSPSLTDAINYYVPEDREVVRRVTAACSSEGAPFDEELQVITAKGRRIWVRAIGEPLRDGRGVITHIQGAFQDISDQKAAQEQIRILAARLLDTFESISDSFFTVDRSWKFVYVNAAAERQLGRDRARMIGRSIWEVFDGRESSLYFSEAHRAVADGIAVHFEAPSSEPGRWIEVDAHPSREGLAVYFRDVTERRKSREALRESEERFRLLSQATNDAIWDWNLVTDMRWWSVGFTKLFGVAENARQPTHADWSDHVHPDERDGVLASANAAVFGSASSWSREYRFRRQDGTYALVLDRGLIIRDDAGKAIRVIGGMTDLSERKRVEERLEEQATLLDKANDAILTRDLEHRVLYWNQSAERVYGWSAAEAKGRSTVELLRPAPESFRAATEITLAKGEWAGELEKSTKDGRTLTLDCRWTLVRDERGAPKSILSIDSDITQRKKMEVQLMRVQRMESIGALASGIAHDLNNTLAPLLVTASMLRETTTDLSLRDDMVTIETCAQRGADMVRQLLSFARGADERREKVDLRPIATATQKLVRDTFPKNIVFRSVVAPDLWNVSANPTQMHQVFTNLCVNARDAMPQGGTLTLEMECVMIDESYAAMNPDAKPGPYVLIRLQDTGTGIPEEILDRIFDPFFTTKEVGKGTGLGLSTLHAIVRNHGGIVHVYSEVGTGTQFKIYLPAITSVGAMEKGALEKPQLPRGHGELVLVVDDEELIRRVTRRTLERYGYRVMLANDGAEAIALYELHRDEIAVVLTDMTMPIMDGPATIAALTKLNADVRIICASGLNAESYDAPSAGAYHFVPKPYTAETMLTVLRTVLADAA